MAPLEREPTTARRGDDDRLLRDALDQATGAAVLVFDRDLVYRRAAGAALRSNGFEPGDLEGRRAPEVLGPTRWPLYREAYEGALEGRAAELHVPAPQGRAPSR